MRNNARPMTTEILEKAEMKIFCWETLARELLGWMSESDVAEFAEHHGYVETAEEDE